MLPAWHCIALLCHSAGWTCPTNPLDGCCVLLQLQILNFVAKAYTLADAYPLMVPQLTEFYVHYHFLHFTRHYYKLPTSPSLTVLACCKGHVKVHSAS